MDTLIGAVERITYYNPENGYTVLRLRPEVKMAHRMAREMKKRKWEVLLFMLHFELFLER
jgi:hypothetical protein